VPPGKQAKLPVAPPPARRRLREITPVYERIVAAIDSDADRADQVVQAAQEMGRAFESNVLIVHVREVERKAAVLAAAGKPGALPPSVHFETEEAARALVDTAVQRLRNAGVSVDGVVGPGAGSTARELLDIAEGFGANVIIVGDRDSRVSDLILGGVAHRIVHLAACPVLLVR